MLRELERKLSEQNLKHYKQELDLYWKTLSQKRTDINKISSTQKLFTACIAKGKVHKIRIWQ